MMRKLFYGFLILTVFAACTKDVKKMSDRRKTTLLEDHDWDISKIVIDSQDYTADFKLDTLTFKKKNKMNVYVDSGITFSGTWYLTRSNTGNKKDDPGKLVIYVTGSDQMDALSDDWTFVSLSNKKVELISNGRNDNKELTLVR